MCRLLCNGERLLAVVDVIVLDAREAAEAVASTRMELVNESDRAAVNRAARDEATDVVRAAERSGPVEAHPQTRSMIVDAA